MFLYLVFAKLHSLKVFLSIEKKLSKTFFTDADRVCMIEVMSITIWISFGQQNTKKIQSLRLVESGHILAYCQQ